MNEMEQLAGMLGHGGKTLLANWAEASPSSVTRWIASNRVEPKRVTRIASGLAEFAVKNGCDGDWLDHAIDLLERCGRCPTCGHVTRATVL